MFLSSAPQVRFLPGPQILQVNGCEVEAVQKRRRSPHLFPDVAARRWAVLVELSVMEQRRMFQEPRRGRWVLAVNCSQPPQPYQLVLTDPLHFKHSLARRRCLG
jgi:hypothetical protein